MEIHCKTCGLVIPARNIDLNGRMVKCERCNSVFSFRDEFSSLSGISRGEIRLPARIKVKRDISGLNIERSWFSPMIIILTFFTIWLSAWACRCLPHIYSPDRLHQ